VWATPDFKIVCSCYFGEKPNDSLELRENIVKIINTLSAEIDLGGEIDTAIMDEHDKIVFPVLFRKMLMDKLNEALNTKDSASPFEAGKYESIWEGEHREYIAFELKKYPGIKLVIGRIGEPELKMVFMADRGFHQFDENRHTGYGGRFRNRFGSQPIVSNPIPNDEDNSKTPALDFSKEESIEIFRREKRNFPDILAKRVSYHLDNWKDSDGNRLDIIGFIEKKLVEQGEIK
jgi:hypothetical protein